jgi:hypothetical protein
MTKLFTKEELISLNEVMLGRGVPVQDDGIGYNKADYGACATYFYGLSDAQYADLAKRLVKYTKTQLNLDKEDMKATAEHFANIAGNKDRTEGVSLNITENGTLISFRYNERYIYTIKNLPQRRYDRENKNWIIPNDKVIDALKALESVGADVKNAIEYARKEIKTVQKQSEKKKKVYFKRTNEETVFLKFAYNKEIVDEIKSISKNHRKYHPDLKAWEVQEDACEFLVDTLANTCVFIKE